MTFAPGYPGGAPSKALPTGPSEAVKDELARGIIASHRLMALLRRWCRAGDEQLTDRDFVAVVFKRWYAQAYEEIGDVGDSVDLKECFK